jgi:hypothetical protein
MLQNEVPVSRDIHDVVDNRLASNLRVILSKIKQLFFFDSLPEIQFLVQSELFVKDSMNLYIVNKLCVTTVNIIFAV